MSILLWPRCTDLLMTAYSTVFLHVKELKSVSDWFLKHDGDFTVLKWPPVSPNPFLHATEQEIVSSCVLHSCQHRPKHEKCLKHLVDAIKKAKLCSNPVQAKCNYRRWTASVSLIFTAFELLLKTTPWKYDILFKLQMHSGVISPHWCFHFHRAPLPAKSNPKLSLVISCAMHET